MAKVGDVVWISCRATPGCDSHQAKIIFIRKVFSGGTVIRYKCMKCGKAFHVHF